MALRIAVVGGGLGGLAAAIAFRRQGHLVEVFEATAEHAEIGAALVLPPNCQRVLESFGYRPENVRGVDNKAMTVFFHSGGPGTPTNQRDERKDYGYQSMTVYRVDIHNELKRLAFEEEGAGPPAILHLGSKAIGCDPSTGEIHFENGDKYKSDLIVGADGIRSTIRTSVAGKVIAAPPSGYAAYRWLTETSKLDGQPELDWVYRTEPVGLRIIMPEKDDVNNRTLIIYPCRDGELTNAAILHRDQRDQDAFDWNATTTKEELLSFTSDFHPKYQAFLKLAPEKLRLWQVRSGVPLDTYVRGRAALVGDAAHAMFPTLAQGASMAVEDAAVLGLLIPMGTTKDQIITRLQTYDKLRRDRDSFIQRESLEQMTIPEKRGEYLRSLEMQDKIMGFNALQLPDDVFV